LFRNLVLSFWNTEPWIVAEQRLPIPHCENKGLRATRSNVSLSAATNDFFFPK
jgi:hypothetical protein